jgi:hypothetical protein
MLESIRQWIATTEKGYESFLRTKTSMYWNIDSVQDATLNLPDKIFDIFVEDITCCYESIPLQGPDNLLEAITFITHKAFRHSSSLHPRATTSIWVRINKAGVPAAAKWATSQPSSANWISFSTERLLQLHAWLMSHCFLTLGDRVWRQCMGIPMGFSCSPIWCTMYLLSYEIKFVQRLAKLGRRDIMSQFKTAFRYIDDLCLINVGNPRQFLSPEQPRVDTNPFWIYPLDILTIKEETAHFSSNNPERGTVAHFMNVEITVHETNPQAYSFRKYDKRRKLPFSYTQYIKFHSNRPIHQAYNIAISQVLPVLYISSTNSAATDEILAIIQTMTSNGFKRDRLLKNICRFLSNGPFPAVRVNIQNIRASL